MDKVQFLVGFANLNENSPYAIGVRESLESALALYPDITLISRDNDLNDDRALANAQEFKDLKVNFVVFFHINERIGKQIKSIFPLTPLLTIDIPIPLSPHFGLNNKQSGEILGKAAIQWINNEWDGRVDKVLALIDSRVLDVVRPRVESTVNFLKRELGDLDVMYLDCGNTREITIQRSVPVLQSWSEHDHILGIGFNADSTFGLLDAGERVACLDHLRLLGHAADEFLVEEVHKPDSPVIATSYFDPRKYGEYIANLIMRVRAGERLPQFTLVDMELIQRET